MNLMTDQSGLHYVGKKKKRKVPNLVSLISYAEYAEGKEKNGPLNPYVHITDEWCQGGSARACAIMFKKI